jgi:hypothetical protein
MTSHFSQPLHVPSATGRDTLVELDRIDWTDLEHAYHRKGAPARPGRAAHDLAASLRRLGDPDADLEASIEELCTSICHQGTIYEATAYAVPFLAAFAAGAALTDRQASHFVYTLGGIGIAASLETSHGSHAGSFGPNVGPVTRQAFRSSKAHLDAMALRNPALADVANALAALVRTDSPDPAALANLRRLAGDEDEDGEDGDE